jgi:hypothetical protein
MHWVLNNVPTWLIGFVLVGGATLATLAALRFVRRRGFVSDEDSVSLGGTLEVVGAIYGIVLAFVIVLMWQSIDTARDAVSDEASALAQFAVDIRVLPPDDRARVEDSLSGYLNAVLDDEWHTMEDGKESVRAHRALDGLFAAMEQVRPMTAVQQTWYEEALSKLNDSAGHRRKRIEAMSNELPVPVDILLFGGGIITLAFVVIHGSRRSGVHTFVVGALTLLIAYNLFLVVILDYPFSGDIRVTPEPFRQGVLTQFERS